MEWTYLHGRDFGDGNNEQLGRTDVQPRKPPRRWVGAAGNQSHDQDISVGSLTHLSGNYVVNFSGSGEQNLVEGWSRIF